MFIIDFEIANPFNEEHIFEIEAYEKKYNLDTKASDYLKNIRQTTSYEEYKKHKYRENEFQIVFFSETNKQITDMCRGEFQNDIKQCDLNFTPISENYKKRALVEKVILYSQKRLNMEEIFIPVDLKDKCFKENLACEDYVDLQEVGDKTVYLIETTD